MSIKELQNHGQERPYSIWEIRLAEGSEADFEQFQQYIELMNPVSVGEGFYRIRNLLGKDVIGDLEERLSGYAKIEVVRKTPTFSRCSAERVRVQ
jgi:hypothetical protein